MLGEGPAPVSGWSEMSAGFFCIATGGYGINGCMLAFIH